MSEIINVGICTVDAIARTIDGYPPPGGLRTFDNLTLTTGGNAVNCSIALAKMGVGCDVVIKVGQDMLGDFVISECRKYGVNVEGVIRSADTHTPFTFVCVMAGGQRSFFAALGTNATLAGEEINIDLVKQAKFCFVTGTMVMTTLDGQPTARFLNEVRKAGVKTLLDTVYMDSASATAWHAAIDPALPALDYFIPSYPEARALTGLNEPDEIARKLQAGGCANVIIKLDERGAFCREANGRETFVPAYFVEKVVDTTGAGDCWSAGFLAGLREGLSMPDAARLGNATAAHCIQAPGASTGIVPLEQIKAFQKQAPQRT